MEESLLKVKNLRAWYSREKPVLDGLSIDLKSHESVGLIGLNGAGKTTFLNILSGLMGQYEVDGIWMNVSPVKFRDKDFKLRRYTVFDEDHSFQYFTFREYLSYVFCAYHREKCDVSELISGFHFEEYTDMLLKDLSTGNKKKAYLITAFALKPELLLLDEPVNGLDFTSTEFLYQLIADYKKYGTILFSSHILESITLTCDRVLVLEGGKISKCFEHKDIEAAQIREALHDEKHV
ncbi:MAG: ABC transporter ATP-binding protein [Faecalicatena sp.]|uniref:ATP-binding cassette domain-containing protein n=1 Tax=Faecalicatena sp. TaxID=2005360 RepID=UPI002585819E|nr:ABC transporter ATP-binding protein [Faecalicatena sp.]MCI6467266.1 ABC transporter ATP-binding protein [Faecalicatena sp.]MDY5620271.1 ABC transporter ATP-binding protein [Lachnospiraceae bacterium]